MTNYFKSWEQLKLEGSQHYKTGEVEPIDLYKSKGAFKPFALCNISKYAMRNVNHDTSINDMVKIIHYAELVIAEKLEQEEQDATKTP
jgi:hypothetical protein